MSIGRGGDLVWDICVACPWSWAIRRYESQSRDRIWEAFILLSVSSRSSRPVRSSWNWWMQESGCSSNVWMSCDGVQMLLDAAMLTLAEDHFRSVYTRTSCSNRSDKFDSVFQSFLGSLFSASKSELILLMSPDILKDLDWIATLSPQQLDYWRTHQALRCSWLLHKTSRRRIDSVIGRRHYRKNKRPLGWDVPLDQIPDRFWYKWFDLLNDNTR